MKSCVSFHWCSNFQQGAGVNHKDLEDKEAPLFVSSYQWLLQKGIRHKLTKMIQLLPWKSWNSHTNFIIMPLHFVLNTKIFWNYWLRSSQQIYVNMKAAWSHLLTAYYYCVQSQPGRTRTRANALSCCLFRHAIRLQNLPWKVWC